MNMRTLLLFGLIWLWPTVLPALQLVPQHISVNGKTTTLQVPTGMVVEFMAEMRSPRFLTVGPDNELLIGSRVSGGGNSSIYRLASPYTSAAILASLPGYFHSVGYRRGTLFAAETDGLWKAAYSGLSTSLSNGDFSKYLDLPSLTGGHDSRTVIVGPDGTLYVGIGISGNCSNEYLAGSLPDYDFEHRRGGVYIVNESGTAVSLEPFSSGLRNPIGIAFEPASGFMWATNAGSDNLGFNEPKEIFSRLSRGSYHGMPWFQYINGSFQDGQCISTNSAPRPARDATPPAVTFDARSTPLGVTFVSGNSLGSAFSGNAIVSIHGSWATDPSRGGGPETRRPPKVVMVTFSNGQPTAVEDVLTGFQRNDGSRFARPSGAVMGPDGHFYFTSDGGDIHGLFRMRMQKAGPGSATGGTGKFTSAALFPLFNRDKN